MDTYDWLKVVAIGATFLGTLLVAYLIGLLVRRYGPLDHPDGDRKKQVCAVARLGGVAIFGAVAPLVLLMPVTLSWPVLGYILVIFSLGLWDDIFTVSTALKLSLLSLASIAAAAMGLHPDILNSPFGTLAVPSVLIAGSSLWLLVFINAANFMDGSNGLSIGSMAIMIGGLSVLMLPTFAFWDTVIWTIALFGAIAGFLIHNLRGKLYMGDAGALGLGALFASLGLISGLEVWTVATLALPFLLDVLMTLIWRAKHRRSWLEPHRDHAYQRLIDSGWSHIEAAVLYWGLSGACAVAAVITAKAGGEAPFVIFWTLTLTGIVMWSLNRRAYRDAL